MCKIFKIIEIDVNYNGHNQYILGAWARSKPLAASNGSQSSGSYFTTKSITRNGPSKGMHIFLFRLYTSEFTFNFANHKSIRFPILF